MEQETKKACITLAALACLVLLATTPIAAQPAPGTLYGSTGAAGATFIQIDPTTGQGTVVAPAGDFGPVTEIVFREDGTLFGSTGGGQRSIIRIDPETGDETLVGQHSGGSVNGMEFIGSDLYGTFFQSGGALGEGQSPLSLVVVDQMTGQLSEVGPILSAFIMRGLALDPATGLLYGVGVANNESEAFFAIDPATAATTLIAPLSTAIGGIRFGPDGLLYGGATSSQTQQGPEGVLGAPLVTIDITNGSVTVVGGGTGQPALSGLAFAPAGQAPVIEVPTISGVGLLVSAILLLAAAWVAIRRRSVGGHA